MEYKNMIKVDNQKELLGAELLAVTIEPLGEKQFGFLIHTFKYSKKRRIREPDYLYLLLLRKDYPVSKVSNRELSKLILEKEGNLTVTEDGHIVPVFFKDSEKSFESIRRTKEYRLFKKLLENGMLS